VEDDMRLKNITDIVESIYKNTIAFAASSSDTIYNFQVPQINPTASQFPFVTIGDHNLPSPFKPLSDPFYITNMSDILEGLQVLFPGCSVSHALLSKGTDGKLYDISKLDDTTLKLVNKALDNSYIVIDWS